MERKKKRKEEVFRVKGTIHVLRPSWRLISRAVTALRREKKKKEGKRAAPVQTFTELNETGKPDQGGLGWLTAGSLS